MLYFLVISVCELLVLGNSLMLSAPSMTFLFSPALPNVVYFSSRIHVDIKFKEPCMSQPDYLVSQ